ncbi:DUF309 domain-containing protein [Halalkalibacter krulwichiae]|uniref:DUF309 domain-containing protein n=1 Tax=Halalkalibacter krulwichiae TaxID=199441 RepID=A0A1X9MC56_9BACI|nr:DUF309 domain-containing protein [Halalkalibacter krulwichiae]ARK30224.1 hypothetical protein BkAM31D_10505 [Halalkalibacter krulwichiae]
MYPTAYLDYIIYFHVERDYFECHEVLEEYWKKKPTNERDDYWVGLIQIAVGLYHHRRQNDNGALRMYQKALEALSNHSSAISQLSLDVAKLEQLLLEQIDSINLRQLPFTDLDLPITDDKLLNACQARCEKLGLQWIFADSQSIKDSIIHKHSRRDRTEVIKERDKQLQKRKERRQ